ncbi:UNVERIFIED_CONTAM: Vacuolar protein sorting-associated protein 53 A [Sesamum calycinum]|uniref:Vacuolar protein sorting-associated protein 53 A n=1 Tax=Sesamum calycinum TaxID=2727403 RepID=A0AAW2LT87_9LAMI
MFCDLSFLTANEKEFSPACSFIEFQVYGWIKLENGNEATSAAAAYSKFVSREMSKAEALLKVILSPVDSVADTYCALLPEGTPGEFQRILDLKVARAADTLVGEKRASNALSNLENNQKAIPNALTCIIVGEKTHLQPTKIVL